MNLTNGNGIFDRQVSAPRPASLRVVEQGDSAQFRVGNYVTTCTIMLVGPELAREWLTKEHPDNRKTPSVTARYAAEMTAGGWKPTPEPIVFSNEDVLINGGNRLRAIVDSGSTVLLTVWTGWPEEAFACFDRNAPRSLYQADQMAGQALPKMLYQIGRASIVVDDNRTTMGDTEVRDRAKALLPAWAALGSTIDAIRIGRSGIRAASALVFCLAWLSDPAAAEGFVMEMKAALAHEVLPSSAVKNFLRWYESAPPTAGTTGARDLAFVTASALRQYANKSDMKMVRPSPDAFHYWRNRNQVRDAITAAVANP